MPDAAGRARGARKTAGAAKTDAAAERALKRRAARVVRRLDEMYPGAECALVHQSALQLLVATILSAQCTDRRVNQVTPALFRRYPDAAAFADADAEELETMIHSTGFFRNKARSIQGACQRIRDEHGGEVPGSMEELLKLPGVARKTANVVLGTWFGAAEGVVVDTHVFRIAHRLGLAPKKNPKVTEDRLMDLLPRSTWTAFSHQVIHHGRAVCTARSPDCGTCGLERSCQRIGVDDAAGASRTGTPGTSAAARGRRRARR